jgi:hypothetical protein
MPLYLYPGLIGRAWPAYLGIVAVVAGCLVAWWEPRPRWRALGATVAVLSTLWLWFLGWVLAVIEACGFAPGCPPRPEQAGAALKGIAIHLGGTLLLIAAWRTAQSVGGRWVSGLVLIGAGGIAAFGIVGLLGLLG